MSYELKIIVGSTTVDTKVYIDERPIGLIQDIKFHANASNSTTELELVFPNLIPFKNTNKQTVEHLELILDLLKNLPHVKVALQDVEFPE